MGKLDGRVAFITGAARGQGRSHAVRLAAEGADIIAFDSCADLATVAYPLATVAELNRTVELVEQMGRRAVQAQVDTRNRKELNDTLDSAVGELGGLDIVVANAGVISLSPAEDMTEEAWSDVIGTNLSGVFFTLQAAIPHLKANPRGGSMIVTSSPAGEKGIENICHYVAAKHGVIGLTKALSNELGRFGIRVNAVVPTTVRTPMVENAATVRLFDPTNTDGKLDSVAGQFAAQHSLPFPWLTPEDVSSLVLFLASDEAKYITGSSMRMDGGVLSK